VFPFYPRPSLDFACRSKKEGGLGLINVEDQVLALHNIYIDRLLSNARPNPLTGVINVLVRLHTGHNSVLPFLMTPRAFSHRLAKVPHLQHLAKLLQRLPIIEISPKWTPRMTRFIPMIRAAHPAPPPTNPVSFAQTIVIKDVIPYSFLETRYDDIYTITTAKHRSLRNALIDGDYEWHPLIARQLHPRYQAEPADGPAWIHVRSFDHWVIPTTSRSNTNANAMPRPPTLTHQAKPGFLRHHWIQTAASPKYDLPAPAIPRSPSPGSLLSRAQWQRFWQLKIPHNVRNCWWRLLIKKLPTRLATRHAHQRTTLDSSCQLCGATNEDDAHMIFYCPRKLSFWRVARYVLPIPLTIPEIWDALNFRHQTDPSTMIKIAHVLQVIWQMHWRCIFDEVPWNTTHALVRLRRVRWYVEGQDGQQVVRDAA
jgi:hypothetical protein